MKSAAVFLLPVLLAAPVASASEATTALSTCLSSSASREDRRLLVRWIYGAMSAHPDLRDISAIDTARHTGLESEAARVMERLIADDCAAQVKQVLVKDGTDGFGTSFETLGRVAMEEFLGQPDVQRASAAVAERIDQQRVIKSLLSK